MIRPRRGKGKLIYGMNGRDTRARLNGRTDRTLPSEHIGHDNSYPSSSGKFAQSPPNLIDVNVEQKARQVLADNRVALFVVAYQAEEHIDGVLRRIPGWVERALAEIYMIDDDSDDNTVTIAQNAHTPTDCPLFYVYRTPYNQGYGGNQKLGYRYALKKEFDIVVLLHGDGQYAPEQLPSILAPYADGADAVFGSRFLKPGDALRGGMPLYKWIGNRILTGLQNAVMGTHLSEWHSGYRSYRTSALQAIPFAKNSSWFDFDTDIIVQLLDAGCRIEEAPIPTYYGAEISRVNGLLYAWRCIKTVVQYRLMQLEIFYDPKFDLSHNRRESVYTGKRAETSLHHYIRGRPISPGSKLLDLGGGGEQPVSLTFAKSGFDVTCVDQDPAREKSPVKHYVIDLDEPWDEQFPVETYDVVFALDVIEHLKSPEAAVGQIYDRMRARGKLYASTANIAFLPVRIMSLFGFFNYGRRGILDMTHRRFFTVGSFRRLLRNEGFRIDRVVAFGPPLSDLTAGRSRFANAIDKALNVLGRSWAPLFSYQFLVEVTRLPSAEELMDQTFKDL